MAVTYNADGTEFQLGGGVDKQNAQIEAAGKGNYLMNKYGGVQNWGANSFIDGAAGQTSALPGTAPRIPYAQQGMTTPRSQPYFSNNSLDSFNGLPPQAPPAPAGAPPALGAPPAATPPAGAAAPAPVAQPGVYAGAKTAQDKYTLAKQRLPWLTLADFNQRFLHK